MLCDQTAHETYPNPKNSPLQVPENRASSQTAWINRRVAFRDVRSSYPIRCGPVAQKLPTCTAPSSPWPELSYGSEKRL